MQTVGSITTITYTQINQEEKGRKMTEEEKQEKIKALEREIEVVEKEILLAKKKKELEELQGFRVRDTFPSGQRITLPWNPGPTVPLGPYYDKFDDSKFDLYRVTCSYEK